MRKIFTFLLLICSTLVGFAQKSVSVSAGNEGGVVEHRYEGATITYAPIVELTDVFSSLTYKWQSTIDGTLAELGSDASLVYNIPNVGTTVGKLVNISVAITGTPKDTTTLPLDTTIHYALYVYATPNASTNAYAAELYAGDETTLSLTSLGGKEGAWSYAWDNNSGNAASCTFKAEKAGEYQVKVLVKNTLGNSNTSYDYSDTLVYTIKVWDECTVSEESYPKALYVDDEITLSFTTSGGKEGAWSYKWDNSDENATSYTFKATEAGEYQVKVLVNNKLNNSDTQYDFVKTLVYTIKVWEKCGITMGGEDGLNCFSGQQVTYKPVVSGGDKNKWTYEWYVDGQFVGNESTYTVTAPEFNDVDSKNVQIALRVTNTPDNIYQPYSETLTATLKVWRIGSAVISTSERIYYHGNAAMLKVETIGGYTAGWTYKWTKLETSENLGSKASISVKLTNTSTNRQIQTYKIEWTNAIGSNVGSSGWDTIHIEVYPQVVEPSFNYNEAIRMRDIDTRTIFVTPGSGGNPNGWSYQWGDGSSVSDFSYTIAPVIASNVKVNQIKFIELHWVNKGPNDTTWAEGTIEQNVVVYNTPATPVLKMKGNGTSNIFIVDEMGMTEEELWANGYNFKFWDGATLVGEMNDQRWCRYDHAPTNAWVQSVWYYEDGFVCEGEAVTASAGYYSPSVKSTVCIYRIDGEFVMQTTVDEMDTIENLYATLEAGLYIVKSVSNGVCSTNKIVIK